MAQRWAVVRMLDSGPPLRRDLADDRRQHGDDHPDRLVAEPRRRRLPRDARQARRRVARRDDAPTPSPAIDEPSPAPRDPQQGPAGRADPAAAPRCRPRLRGARPQPRRAASRTTTSTSCSSGPTTSSSSSATASPTSASPASTCCAETGAELPRIRDARLRPLPARGGRPERHAVPGGRGPRRPAGRDRPPEHGPPLLRGPRRSRSRSSRSRARSRSRRASGWPRRSSTSCRPARRWSMNGLRQIGDVLASEAVLVANPAADRERADGARRRSTRCSAR